MMGRSRNGSRSKRANTVEVDKSRLKFKARQSASATINQGGNAIAINANELGNIRVRAGQQA